MTTLALFLAGVPLQRRFEMNTLQFIPALTFKCAGNEYFSLAIPFFASELLLTASPRCGFQRERFSRRVGGVPRLVRKVAFRTWVVPGLLTLVNRLF